MGSSTKKMRVGEARSADGARRGRGGMMLITVGVVVAAVIVAGSGAEICGSEESGSAARRHSR
jgi:hypothetical protein